MLVETQAERGLSLACCVQLTGQHRSASPAADASPVHSAQARKEVFFVDASLLCLVKLVGEDIEHQLAIAICVDMPMGLVVKETLELLRVDEVSIMSKANTVRAVNVKRLRFRVGTASSRRISKMAQTHKSRKIRHPRAVVKDLGGHAIAFALIDAAT